jgi:outer membrane protein assembly complex protein YaeT
LEEGEPYTFGRVDVVSSRPETDLDELAATLAIAPGQRFSTERVEQAVAALTARAADLGYSFVDVRPRGIRDASQHTIGVEFEIAEGPAVFVERIEISGNFRTVDRVIRREMRVVEGDGFNETKLGISERRLENLGIFESVEIRPRPGSAADRVVVSVEVVEQATGSVEIGLGVSSSKGPVFTAGVEENNLLGRGQRLVAAFESSLAGMSAELSLTEPYFLDRPIIWKFGFQVGTGAAGELSSAIAGFGMTFWLGLVVVPLPLVVLFTMRTAYMMHLRSSDYAYCRKIYSDLIKLLKAVILAQVTFFMFNYIFGYFSAAFISSPRYISDVLCYQ